MSLDTFTPMLTPSTANDKPEIKIEKADFGEGYSQASRKLNNVRRVISLKWDVLTQAQADPIIAFFFAHHGTDAFLYTIPGETTPVQWTCEDYEQAYAAARYRSITATLRQSFNIVGS